MAPAELRTLTITTEIRSPHVITLLCGGQVVGTLDLRKYMPRRTKLRLAVTCWTKSVLAKLCSKHRPW
ncbi:hypothetical protein [Mycobacteroides abscessus]|uniref:hypothetical protein n=1 Tax=Mycobacteroides abscessus TaxID=36809 RepID=UPI0009A5A313|nr:hypothetical protein [Mycobacteroides abscessus]SLG54240.1 Uncharacterised protein [Mycobacteroides abscessus subsp. massiliense]